MIFKAIGIMVCLLINMGIYSLVFWLLLGKAVKIGRAFQLSTAALVLNKFLLTGAGYAAASAKLKNDNVAFHKSLPAFIFMEFLFVVPLLASGLYYGAHIVVRAPLFLLGFILLLAIFALYKRKKIKGFFREVASEAKAASAHLWLIIPLVAANIFLIIVYYKLLLGVFNIPLSFYEIYKLVAVSFTIGYLSPVPSGLAFKEGSLIYLLMQKGQAFNTALSLAITDRAIITGFYIILGFLCAGHIVFSAVREEYVKRVNKQKAAAG